MALALLALETTWEQASLCLLRGDRMLAASRPSRHTLARDLLPWISSLLAAADLTPAQLTAVAASIGPGSFTGTRIGVTTAKTLALVLGVPLLGIPTLDVVAHAAATAAGRYTSLLALLPAHRQDYFVGQYQRTRLGPAVTASYQVLAAGEVVELASRLPPPVLLGGAADRIEAFAEAGAPGWRVVPWPHSAPRATSVALLANRRHFREQWDDPLTLAPLYLRAAPADLKQEAPP